VYNSARVPTRKPNAKTKTKTASRRQAPAATLTTLTGALAALEKRGTQAYRQGLTRYGIVAPQAFGVSMTSIHALAKLAGKNHPLALELWSSKWYEARLLACFVAEPERVTPALMERWTRDFDNWAVCDTACFHLFDRTPHAFDKIAAWAKRDEEFVKRAAFALLASVALHDRAASEAAFVRALPLIERAADDPRNFVKKAVLWALRGVGGRTPALHAKATALAQKLATRDAPPARFIGKSALRELTSPAARRRLERQRIKP
jgi:3-methyladenine DNA glycosylase AlkD